MSDDKYADRYYVAPEHLRQSFLDLPQTQIVRPTVTFNFDRDKRSSFWRVWIDQCALVLPFDDSACIEPDGGGHSGKVCADGAGAYRTVRIPRPGARDRAVAWHRAMVAWVMGWPSDEPLPAGLIVRHRCQTKPYGGNRCANLAHLMLGDAQANVNDATMQRYLRNRHFVDMSGARGVNVSIFR